MSFANVDKLEELGRHLARAVTDGEAARLLLYGMPMRTIFLMQAALDPVVQGARERTRRRRPSDSEGDEVRGDTVSLSWRIVKKDPAA